MNKMEFKEKLKISLVKTPWRLKLKIIIKRIIR